MNSKLVCGVDPTPTSDGTKTREIRRPKPIELLTTGIAGLDDILGGGLARNHLYLIEGDPGNGKDHDRDAISDGGCPARPKGPLCHALRIED